MHSHRIYAMLYVVYVSKASAGTFCELNGIFISRLVIFYAEVHTPFFLKKKAHTHQWIVNMHIVQHLHCIHMM